MTFDLGTLASAATAIGVCIGAWQIRLAKLQSITAFEDSIAKEYREIAATLPTKALLGEALTEEEHLQHFDEFYRYFDLCNEQAYLQKKKRITKATWEFWQDGIRGNLRRPAFSRAWQEISSRAPADFSELREVVSSSSDMWRQ